MKTIILCAILGFIYGALAFASCDSCATSEFFDATTICTMIGAFVGTALAMAVGVVLPTPVVVNEAVKLLAMRSSDGLSGTFVWGSGSIGNKTSYNFLQAMDDGSMVPGSVEADGLVHLIEDPQLQNVGFWRTTIRQVDPNAALKSWAIGTDSMKKIVRQEFRVPVGTVLQQFNVR